VEAILAILLALASAVGAVFWRKTVQLRSAAHDQVENLRDDAREHNELREKTIEANMDHLDEEITKVTDDEAGRQELADLLNRALDD
tara:strand:+ start:1277 stop:1537 length:261 start_codon:yes stop_codon:yes gene_type:complete